MVSKHPAKGDKVAESMMAVFASGARGAIVVRHDGQGTCCVPLPAKSHLNKDTKTRFYVFCCCHGPNQETALRAYCLRTKWALQGHFGIVMVNPYLSVNILGTLA